MGVINIEESIGQCKNVLRCKAYMVDLANGYCVDCWDKGHMKRK